MTEPDWIPLRFRDLDAFGHVYHAEYLTLLDEARSRWFGTVGVGAAEDYVLAHLEIDWVSSLTAEDTAVRGTFEVESIGTTSITLGELLHAADGREVSRGRSVNVLWDPREGVPRPLTAEQRAGLEGHSR